MHKDPPLTFEELEAWLETQVRAEEAAVDANPNPISREAHEAHGRSQAYRFAALQLGRILRGAL